MLTNQMVARLIKLLNQGHHKEVITELSRLIKTNPKVPGLHELLGTAHARHGNFEKAERSLRRALKLMPKLTSAQFNLGELYLSTDRFSQAVGCFEALVRATPDDGRIRVKLANALVKIQLPDQAIPHLEHAARLRQR